MRRPFDRSMKQRFLEPAPRPSAATRPGADERAQDADPPMDADWTPDADGVPPAWRRQWRDGGDSPYSTGSVPDLAWRFGRELDRREQGEADSNLGPIGRDPTRDGHPMGPNGQPKLVPRPYARETSTTRALTGLRRTPRPGPTPYQRPRTAKQPGLDAGQVEPDKSSFGTAALFGSGSRRRAIAVAHRGLNSGRIENTRPRAISGAPAPERLGSSVEVGVRNASVDGGPILRVSEEIDASPTRVPLGAPEDFQKIGDKTYPDGWRTPRQAPESSYAEAPRLINPIPGGKLRNDGAGKGWYLAPREDSHGHRYDHTGIDIAAAAGEAVVSPIGGRVTKIGRVHGDLRYVQITTPDERYVVRVLYTAPSVKVGESVDAGATIGQVQSASAGYGNPAMSDHVHLEVWDVKLPGIVDAVRPREKRWGHLEPTRLMDDFEL